MQNVDVKRYKYSAVAMVAVYVLLTALDLLKNNLSNQATIIFSSYMFVDQLVLYVQTKKKRAIVVATVMALIILLFLYDYAITYLNLR